MIMNKYLWHVPKYHHRPVPPTALLIAYPQLTVDGHNNRDIIIRLIDRGTGPLRAAYEIMVIESVRFEVRRVVSKIDGLYCRAVRCKLQTSPKS